MNDRDSNRLESRIHAVESTEEFLLIIFMISATCKSDFAVSAAYVEELPKKNPIP
jgi:hypothetical protein